MTIMRLQTRFYYDLEASTALLQLLLRFILTKISKCSRSAVQWNEGIICFTELKFEPQLNKTNKMTCAPSKDTDQPGHPPSLIRVFAVCMKKHLVFSYPLSAQQRLIRLGGCPGWCESSLGVQAVLLCCGSFDICHIVGWIARLGDQHFNQGSVHCSCGSLCCYDTTQGWCMVNMSLVTRKPVAGVLDQVRLKPACKATEAVVSRGIILSRQRTTKVLIRVHGCVGWSAPLLFAHVINRFSHDLAQLILWSVALMKYSWKSCAKTHDILNLMNRVQ